VIAGLAGRMQNRMLWRLDGGRVTEKVFGFLLAALGVQLVLEGLADVGAIHLAIGH
jgi:small neutral amino acid transporter SnatA (MarC family)